MTNAHEESVREFFHAFKQDRFIGPHEGGDNPLRNMPEGRLDLKMALIAEEFTELVEAVYGVAAGKIVERAFERAVRADDGNRDYVEAADATADLRYVIEGFDIEAGFPADRIFREVHLSNMSKLDKNGEPIISDGSTGKPVGKLLKSDRFFEPDIRAIIHGKTPDRTPLAEK